jgi:hypothetical protein
MKNYYLMFMLASGLGRRLDCGIIFDLANFLAELIACGAMGGRLPSPNQLPLPPEETMRRFRDLVRRLVEARDGPQPAPDPKFVAGLEEYLKDYHEDILSILRKVGHRLTTSKVLSALAHAGKPYGETTVKQALRDLCRPPFELLDNRQDTRPKGYGLREWS